MNDSLARALYALLLRLALPAYFARLWWRGRVEPGYRAHWGERLGAGPPQPPGRLWLHAVSLGETRAAAPLIAALRAARPGLRLLLTHGTATGREAGRALLREGDAQAWLPYDTPGAVRRFLRRHRPAAGVVLETEVWPALLHAAQAAGVPMALVNARLSAKSARQGRRFAALLHPALARFDSVLAQTEADAARLRAAGARGVRVLGNLKFDLDVPPALLQSGRAWRAGLDAHRAPGLGTGVAAGPHAGRTPLRGVVLAAVMREGEDAPLLAAWAAQPAPRPLLVLVPRHPQRFDEVAALIRGAGFTLARRSSWGDRSPPPEAAAADVWLGDSLGELPLYYALSDVALLGGSYAPLGGQNLIEAAACGCPLLIGPHTYNFAQAADDAVAAGAAERLPDLPQAVARALALLGDAPARAAMAARATAFAAAHRGAAARVAQVVLGAIDPADEPV